MLCPICKTPLTDKANHPFCSRRCADIDLHRWLAGHYAIPTMTPPDDMDGDNMDESADTDAASGDDDVAEGHNGHSEGTGIKAGTGGKPPDMH